jgi:UV excision repair protein RAD23
LKTGLDTLACVSHTTAPHALPIVFLRPLNMRGGVGVGFRKKKINEDGGLQEGPQLLQPLLEQIGQQHPEVLEAIQSNQDEFVRLINEPIDPAHLAQAQMAMQAMGGGGIGGLPGMGGGGDEGGGGAVQIHLTPAEGEALARLEALGFPRQVALEAYLACDKKEEIAANYLFENGMDDGED